MRKLLNKPWVVGLLALCAVGLVAFQGFGFSTIREKVLSVSAVQAPETAEAEETKAEAVTDNLTATDMFFVAGSRDPFAPRVTATASTEKAAESTSTAMQTLKLAAVWLQGAESFVAINAQICRVGDAVAGASIESVTREGAWLRLPNGRQFLPVGREVTFAAPLKRGLSSALVVSREH
jgi:hypothetical protein